jgi:peroxiredoxin
MEGIDMARTPSIMADLGTIAPNFELTDVVTGQKRSMKQLAGERGLLVMFICRHCPFVQHIQEELAKLGRNYRGRELGIVAISSNDADSYPDDAPSSLKEQAEQEGFTFPYLYDETQEVAKAYQAVCTPDFFLFDRNLALVYRGQLDDSRPGNQSPVTGRDLRRAVDSLLAGEPLSTEQKPSLGCNIKWKL